MNTITTTSVDSINTWNEFVIDIVAADDMARAATIASYMAVNGRDPMVYFGSHIKRIDTATARALTAYMDATPVDAGDTSYLDTLVADGDRQASRRAKGIRKKLAAARLGEHHAETVYQALVAAPRQTGPVSQRINVVKSEISKILFAAI